LTAPALNAHNSFEQPDRVKPAEFTGFSAEGGSLRVELPAKSLVVLTLG
jgi:alpha-N-arabinofuranosidase